MSEEYLKVIASGPDWMTLTAQDREESRGLWSVWADYLRDHKAQSISIKKWQWLGYRGWTYNGISFGVRNDDEAALVASGSHALSLRPGNLSPSARCTRMDIQVSAQFETPRPTFGMLLYHDLQSKNASRKKERYYKLIQSNSGDSFYVNKRTSQVMLRLYDKSFDYGHKRLGMVWRWEVEFKKDWAQAMYKHWMETEDVHQWSIERVGHEFQKRSVPANWWVATTANAIEVKTKVTTAQSKLSWLVRCVRPVVLQLGEAGFELEAEQALYGTRTSVLAKGDTDVNR